MHAFYDAHGIAVIHAWGMTEMSPLGTVARAAGRRRSAPRRSGPTAYTQGRFPAGVEARLVGPGRRASMPWDGESVGELEVRGPWITGAYYIGEDEPATRRQVPTTAGCAPATSARSPPTASSPSPTAPRT